MSNQFETPVLFLIFNRPDTTQQVFDQIRQIKPKYLFIAADGPRKERVGEIEKCELTRNILLQIDWQCELKTLFRDTNLGCKVAVSSAITWFFENVNEGIILEDDCYPNLTFFRFCQELLEKYRNNPDIFHIGGNNFQKGVIRNEGSYYFSYYPNIWGWASWKRAWYLYDKDIFDYDSENSVNELKHIFNSKSEKQYWNKLFSNCKKGYIDTWDYQWFYCIWKNRGLSITPNTNMIINLGFQNNSTHYFLNDSYKSELKCEGISFPLLHPDIKIDREADIFTYDNLFSHSIRRLIRLFNENKLKALIKYYFRIKYTNILNLYIKK